MKAFISEHVGAADVDGPDIQTVQDNAQAAEREARAILAETEPHSGYRLDTEHAKAAHLSFYREPREYGTALAESLAAFVALEIS